MSKLAKDDQNHRIQAIRPETVQTVAVGGSSVPTANPVQGSTGIAVITCDVDAIYCLGDAPTVDATNGNPLWAKQPVFIRVRPGKDKIAFKQLGADSGTAYVSEGGDTE